MCNYINHFMEIILFIHGTVLVELITITKRTHDNLIEPLIPQKYIVDVFRQSCMSVNIHLSHCSKYSCTLVYGFTNWYHRWLNLFLFYERLWAANRHSSKKLWVVIPQDLCHIYASGNRVITAWDSGLPIVYAKASPKQILIFSKCALITKCSHYSPHIQ